MYCVAEMAETAKQILFVKAQYPDHVGMPIHLLKAGSLYLFVRSTAITSPLLPCYQPDIAFTMKSSYGVPN